MIRVFTIFGILTIKDFYLGCGIIQLAYYLDWLPTGILEETWKSSLQQGKLSNIRTSRYSFVTEIFFFFLTLGRGATFSWYST